jgi:hypothetical protein
LRYQFSQFTTIFANSSPENWVSRNVVEWTQATNKADQQLIDWTVMKAEKKDDDDGM